MRKIWFIVSSSGEMPSHCCQKKVNSRGSTFVEKNNIASKIKTLFKYRYYPIVSAITNATNGETFEFHMVQ